MTNVVVAVLSAVDEPTVAVVTVVVECTPPGSPSWETVAVWPAPSPTVSPAGPTALTSLPWSRENGIPISTAHRISPQTMMAMGTPRTHHGRGCFGEAEAFAFAASGTADLVDGTATGRGEAGAGGTVAGGGVDATRVTGAGGIIMGSVSASSSSTATLIPHRGQNEDPTGIEAPHSAQTCGSAIGCRGPRSVPPCRELARVPDLRPYDALRGLMLVGPGSSGIRPSTHSKSVST